MRRIAVPMIGGMVSSTLLTLVVIPAVFGLVKGFRLPRGSGKSRRSLLPAKPETTSQRIPEPAE